MKIKFARNIIVLIGLLAFLSSGQAGAQGYIWCFGDNDHTELEYIPSATCDSDQNGRIVTSHAGETIKFHPQDEHDTPCVDVPTFSEANDNRTQGHNLHAKLQSHSDAQTVVLPTFAQALIAQYLPQPPPRISQTLLNHRTIVLLN